MQSSAGWKRKRATCGRKSLLHICVESRHRWDTIGHLRRCHVVLVGYLWIGLPHDSLISLCYTTRKTKRSQTWGLSETPSPCSVSRSNTLEKSIFMVLFTKPCISGCPSSRFTMSVRVACSLIGWRKVKQPIRKRVSYESGAACRLISERCPWIIYL